MTQTNVTLQHRGLDMDDVNRHANVTSERHVFKCPFAERCRLSI